MSKKHLPSLADSKAETVSVPAVNKKIMKLTVEGISPLMTNNPESMLNALESSQTGAAKAKRAPKDPKLCYENAFYRLSDGRPGIPASAFKKAAVAAGRFLDDFKMTEIRGAFHVVPEEGDLLVISGKPVMDRRKVGVQGKADLRYRPRFDEWECSFNVIYNSNFITPAQIANLFENAGFGVGVCEWRPEKNGSFGMFKLKV